LGLSEGRRGLAPRVNTRHSVLAFPPEVRRVIDTTNALECVHARLRKIIKTRGHFPTDEAATKLLWLALRNITATWVRGARTWKHAMNLRDPLRESFYGAERVEWQRRREHGRCTHHRIVEGRSDKRLTHEIH